MKIKELKKKIELENPEIVSIVAKDLGYQIGKRVEMLRLSRGLTQTELARKLGTRQSSISRIESGATLPSLSFLVKIAEALETTITAPQFASIASHCKEDFDISAKFARTVSDFVAQSQLYPSRNVDNAKVVFA